MLLKPLLLLGALTLAGCANIGAQSSHVRYPDSTANPPAPARTTGAIKQPAPANSGVYLPPPVTIINAPEPAPSDSPGDTSPTTDPSYNRPRPASGMSDAPKPLGNAVGSLITQAQNQYQQGNYQGAIATAERGLRIDRRTPELYLILAKSYLQLGQTDQSAQFANQGLRYSTSGSNEAADLEATRHQALGN